VARLRIACALACLAVATPTFAECIVRSASADVNMRVRPGGARPFPLALHALPFLVAPGRGRLARVHASGPIAFVGEARDLEYWIASPVDAMGGQLRLRQWSKLVRVARAGDVLVGTARLGIGVRIPRARARCDSLSLDVPNSFSPTPEPPAPDSEDLYWARGPSIFLHAGPGARAGVRVVGPRPELAFEDLGVQGRWRRVRFREGDSSVEGWADHRELRPAREEPFGIGIAGMGDGCGIGFDGGPGVFEGPARIARGTVVFAHRGRGPWGVVETDEALRIRHVRGAAWARILTAPGMFETCHALDHAWVAQSAVDFPLPSRP